MLDQAGLFSPGLGLRLDAANSAPITDRPVNMRSITPRSAKAPRSLARRSSLVVSTSTIGLLLASSATALAQGNPGPEPSPEAKPAPAAPAPTPARNRVAEELAPLKGGLTPAEVARLRQNVSPNIRVKELEVKAAAAKADQALLNYLPRVSVTATYTRLSEVKNSLGVAGGASVGAEAPGVLAPCSDPANILIPGQICTKNVDANGMLTESRVGAVENKGFSFPVLLNSYSFTAQIALPISDYVLRISQGYAVASHNENAKRIELEAERLAASADAKITFYNWIRAKGGAVVTKEAVAQADAHLTDVKRAFDVGLASKGDVLRLEAQVASAQQLAADTEALANLSEEQLRLLLALPPDKPLAIGIDVMDTHVEPSNIVLTALQDEALAKRLEIRALDETEMSLKNLVAVNRAGYFPRIDAFADANYANPNQRVFPQKDEFRFTWDAGVRLSWTINDTLTTLPAVTEAQARVEQIAAQKEALRQGLRLEVASAFAELKRAEANLEAADRGLAAAEEGVRVQTELIRAGKATGVALVDAEAELTRARLRHVDVRVAILVAKTRLEHVTGRDIPNK